MSTSENDMALKCALALRTEPRLTRDAFIKRFATPRENFNNTYVDNHGRTFLHLAVEAEQGEIATWLAQNGSNISAQDEKQNYCFGLKKVFSFKPEVVKSLLCPPPWVARGAQYDAHNLQDSSYHQQFSRLCGDAIIHDKPDILRTCLDYISSIPGNAFVPFGQKAMPNSSLKPLAWLCAHPTHADIFKIVCEFMGDGFWTNYAESQDVYKADQAISQEDSYKVDLFKSYHGKDYLVVTPFEIALLHGNVEAAQQLLAFASTTPETIGARCSATFKNNPNRCMLIFNYLVSRMQTLMNSEDLETNIPKITMDWRMACFLIQNAQPLVPQKILGLTKLLHSQAALNYFDYELTDASELNKLKQWFHIVTFMYFQGVSDEKGRTKGLLRAAHFMSSLTALRTTQSIWQALSQLLAISQKTLHSHSYRAMIIKYILLCSKTHRDYFALNVADFPTEGKPWWNNTAIPIAFSCLVSLKIVPPIACDEQTNQEFLNALTDSFKLGARNYLLEHCRDKKDSFDGINHAARAWVAFSQCIMVKEQLLELYKTLTQGVSFDKDSFRGHVFSAMLQNTVVQTILPSATQKQFTKALKTYCLTLWPEAKSEFKASWSYRLFASSEKDSGVASKESSSYSPPH
jgi:ankyrin repeat protein